MVFGIGFRMMLGYFGLILKLNQVSIVSNRVYMFKTLIPPLLILVLILSLLIAPYKQPTRGNIEMTETYLGKELILF